METKTQHDETWTLHFEHDGTEDVAFILDEDGEELVQSRAFWLPEGDDPVPPTLAALQLMVTAKKLLTALEDLVEVIGEPPITEREGSFSQSLRQAQAAISESTTWEGRAMTLETEECQ